MNELRTVVDDWMVPPEELDPSLNRDTGRGMGGQAFNVQDVLLAAECPLMPDAEAYNILRHISQAQAELADIDANAKTMKAQLKSDLADYLGGYDRITRLETWHASKLTGKRRSVTVLTGTIGKKAVPARCIVTDTGLALPWLKAHCPAAVEEKVVAKNLPDPTTTYDENGEVVWTAPGPGLLAEPERDELTINGRMLSVLLRGGKDGDDE